MLSRCPRHQHCVFNTSLLSRCRHFSFSTRCYWHGPEFCNIGECSTDLYQSLCISVSFYTVQCPLLRSRVLSNLQDAIPIVANPIVMLQIVALINRIPILMLQKFLLINAIPILTLQKFFLIHAVPILMLQKLFWSMQFLFLRSRILLDQCSSYCCATESFSHQCNSYSYAT